MKATDTLPVTTTVGGKAVKEAIADRKGALQQLASAGLQDCPVDLEALRVVALTLFACHGTFRLRCMTETLFQMNNIVVETSLLASTARMRGESGPQITRVEESVASGGLIPCEISYALKLVKLLLGHAR